MATNTWSHRFETAVDDRDVVMRPQNPKAALSYVVALCAREGIEESLFLGKRRLGAS